jgi:hypothetical protein
LVWATIPEVGQAHLTVIAIAILQCPQPRHSWQVKKHKLCMYVGFDAVAGPAHTVTVRKVRSVHIVDPAVVVRAPQAALV